MNAPKKVTAPIESTDNSFWHWLLSIFTIKIETAAIGIKGEHAALAVRAPDSQRAVDPLCPTESMRRTTAEPAVILRIAAWPSHALGERTFQVDIFSNE
jgi:hypothetical protein